MRHLLTSHEALVPPGLSMLMCCFCMNCSLCSFRYSFCVVYLLSLYSLCSSSVCSAQFMCSFPPWFLCCWFLVGYCSVLCLIFLLLLDSVQFFWQFMCRFLFHFWTNYKQLTKLFIYFSYRTLCSFCETFCVVFVQILCNLLCSFYII